MSINLQLRERKRRREQRQKFEEKRAHKRMRKGIQEAEQEKSTGDAVAQKKIDFYEKVFAQQKEEEGLSRRQRYALMKV